MLTLRKAKWRRFGISLYYLCNTCVALKLLTTINFFLEKGWCVDQWKPCSPFLELWGNTFFQGLFSYVFLFLILSDYKNDAENVRKTDKHKIKLTYFLNLQSTSHCPHFVVYPSSIFLMHVYMIFKMKLESFYYEEKEKGMSFESIRSKVLLWLHLFLALSFCTSQPFQLAFPHSCNSLFFK